MMCTTCGCGEGQTRIEGGQHPQHDHHDQDDQHLHRHDQEQGQAAGHHHAHAPGMSQARMVRVEQDILAKNNAYAMGNRNYFSQYGVFAINLVSGPGSGKTTLLTETIGALQRQLKVAVVEGDQETDRDAERIRATGVPTIQINTGKGCHLDAHMISHAVERLGMEADTLLLIENVGNLVCPASFDLGEAHKVVILSVTEGDDKPIKYPDMFHAADLMLINKMDLLPYVDFDPARCIEFARRVNPDIQVFQVSATRGDGMAAWLQWIKQGQEAAISRKTQLLEGLLKNGAQPGEEVAGTRMGRNDRL